DRTGEPSAANEALKAYRAARAAWADLADRAKGAYAANITYGPNYFHRGHWLDRLRAIDDDIADMDRRSRDKRPTTAPAIGDEHLAAAIAAALTPTDRPAVPVEHVPPATFQRGKAV